LTAGYLHGCLSAPRGLTGFPASFAVLAERADDPPKAEKSGVSPRSGIITTKPKFSNLQSNNSKNSTPGHIFNNSLPCLPYFPYI
jgi:hypothetical protein